MADKLISFGLKTFNDNENIHSGTRHVVPIMSDITGKDLVDEIRRLRVAIYTTHDNKPDNKPAEDISIKNLMEENEVYKEDIEEYRNRIKQLNDDLDIVKMEYNKLSRDMDFLLINLFNIFVDDDIEDNEIEYEWFINRLNSALTRAKRDHKRFFKDHLLFYMAYGDLFTKKEIKEYEHELEIE